jgi:hypothetical protein
MPANEPQRGATEVIGLRRAAGASPLAAGLCAAARAPSTTYGPPGAVRAAPGAQPVPHVLCGPPERAHPAACPGPQGLLLGEDGPARDLNDASPSGTGAVAQELPGGTASRVEGVSEVGGAAAAAAAAAAPVGGAGAPAPRPDTRHSVVLLNVPRALQFDAIVAEYLRALCAAITSSLQLAAPFSAGDVCVVYRSATAAHLRVDMPDRAHMLAALALCNSSGPGLAIAGECIQIGTAGSSLVGVSPRALTDAAALLAAVQRHLDSNTRFPRPVGRPGPPARAAAGVGAAVRAAAPHPAPALGGRPAAPRPLRGSPAAPAAAPCPGAPAASGLAGCGALQPPAAA